MRLSLSTIISLAKNGPRGTMRIPLSKAAKIIRLAKNWPHVIDAYRNGSPLLKVELRNGVTLEAPESAQLQYVFDEVFITEVYKIYPFEGRIVDIGANVGVFAAYAFSNSNDVTIDAFEPFPESANCFRKAFAGIPNVRLFQKAVAGVAGRRGLNHGENWLMHSIGEGENIETVTLDEITPCDLLKIDCEGAEYEILYNSRCDFKYIVAEYHHRDDDRKNGEALKTYLQSVGFSVDVFDDFGDATGIIAARRQ